jgi:hypothetical protein
MIVFAMTDNETAMLLVVGISVAAYFLPTLIAGMRGHRNTLAIFALNLFLGWSGLGWLFALIWSCTSTRPTQHIVYHHGPTGRRWE